MTLYDWILNQCLYQMSLFSTKLWTITTVSHLGYSKVKAYVEPVWLTVWPANSTYRCWTRPRPDPTVTYIARLSVWASLRIRRLRTGCTVAVVCRKQVVGLREYTPCFFYNVLRNILFIGWFFCLGRRRHNKLDWFFYVKVWRSFDLCGGKIKSLLLTFPALFLL